jgi:lipopolysaccharide export system protein LptA
VITPTRCRPATTLVAALATLVAGSAAELQAQQGRPCEIVITGVARGADTTRVRSVTTPTGGRNMYIGGIVDATCAGQGNRLLADSAEHFTERGLLILYHNVRYTEPRMTMTSDRMFYYTNEERIVAEGNVNGRSASGTRFTGPQIEYFRAKPGLRAESSWIATGRPFVRMSPNETGGPQSAVSAASDSTDLTANRVVSRNDSLVWASGAVVIDRHDMRATSDSAALDNGTEFARLLRDPQVVGKGEDPFTLTVVVIDTWSRDRELQRVVSAGDARAVSDSLTLTSDTLDLRFLEQQIERIHAWGGRAVANATAQRIESDSMDIRMPGQTLEELFAVGKAEARSSVDTTRVVSAERDWIAGDTVHARFETVTDSTGAGGSRMKEVTALGNARSFYQVPPAGGVRGVPNLSYSRGRVITVLFEAGEMSTVSVIDQASGIYLESLTPPAARPDSTPVQGRRP